MEKHKSARAIILRIPAVIVTAVLFVVYFCLFINGFDNYKDAGFLYAFAGKWERILLAFLALCFFLLLYRASTVVFSRCCAKTCRLIRIGMWLCCFLFQGFFLFFIRSYYKWDSGFVIGGAASLAERGSVADEAYYYLSVYPNQNTFVVITAILIKLCNIFGVSVVNRPLVLNLFNTVCMDVSVFWLYLLIKKIDRIYSTDEKKERDGMMSRILLFLLCNPFLYLGVSYYYTITLSWIFTVGFLYLTIQTKGEAGDQQKTDPAENRQNKKRIYRWIAAGILLGVGYELRATAIIAAAAVFLMGIFNLFHSGKQKAGRFAAQAGMILAAAALSAQLLSAGQRAYIGIDTTDTAFPAAHWIMMSLTYPGGHNEEDEAFTASFSTREEKETAVDRRICEKLQTMGIKDCLSLIAVKIKRTFGDGLNGYPTFLSDGYGTGRFYEICFGEQKDFVILWHQGYYLFFMLGMLYAIYKTLLQSFCLSDMKEKEYGLYMIRAFLILILFLALIFYILWEASEQYSVPFMPVMLCLAAFADNEVKVRQTSRKKGSIRIGCVFFPALLFALWCVAAFSRFTDLSYEQSHTAAVQILANSQICVDDGEELVQGLRVNSPFNQLIIQWRNPAEAANDAVYDVILCDKSGQNIYMTERITAAESGYNGAGIYRFDRVAPAQNGIRDYEIRIRKIRGNPECDLLFVLYDMYGYTPYPGGALLLYNEDKTVKMQDSSLLFLLSEETECAYTSPLKYIFFASCLFLIFLFMGFCCKIKGQG